MLSVDLKHSKSGSFGSASSSLAGGTILHSVSTRALYDKVKL